jgi:hypothetical protein
MSKKYNRKETIDKIEKAVQNMATFYQQYFLKRSGNASDTREPYSEIIAKYLLDHLDLWGKIEKITRKKPYQTESHIGLKDGDDMTNREEEWLAKSMLGKSYDGIGEVIDYQTPLMNERADKAGKIDLLSKPNSSTLYLIELKRESNPETLLRCVLEVYTYSKIVDGEKLLMNFELEKNTNIVPIVAVFKNGVQHKQLDTFPNVTNLMKTLGVGIVTLSNDVKVESVYLPRNTP